MKLQRMEQETSSWRCLGRKHVDMALKLLYTGKQALATVKKDEGVSDTESMVCSRNNEV